MRTIFCIFLFVYAAMAEITIVEIREVSTTRTGIVISFTVKSTRDPASAKSFQATVPEADLVSQIGTAGQTKTLDGLLGLIVAARKAEFSQYFQSGDTVLLLGNEINVRIMP